MGTLPTADKLKDEYSDLKQIKNDFESIINSDKMFFYTRENNNPDALGYVNYDINNKYYVVHTNEIFWDVSSVIVHENTHAVHNIDGRLNYCLDDNYDLKNYDYQDEFEAFTNQYNYEKYIEKRRVLSASEIRKFIIKEYSQKPYIIPVFIQLQQQY